MSNTDNMKKSSNQLYHKFERYFLTHLKAVGSYTDQLDPHLNADSIKAICDLIEPVSLRRDREPSKLYSLSVVCDIVEHDSNHNPTALVEIKCHKQFRTRSALGDVLYRMRDPQSNCISKNEQAVNLHEVSNPQDYMSSLTVIVGHKSFFVMQNMTIDEFWKTSGINSIAQLAHTLLTSNHCTIYDYYKFIALKDDASLDTVLFDADHYDALLNEVNNRASMKLFNTSATLKDLMQCIAEEIFHLSNYANKMQSQFALLVECIRSKENEQQAIAEYIKAKTQLDKEYH
jgi:hypothetical protein